MEIQTPYFGIVSCSEKDFIHFSDGLFGFNELKTYIPLAFYDDSDALICLQSIENENTSFIIMNPFLFYPEYSPDLPEEDKRLLNISDEEGSISYYVICVVHDSLEDSTVNLKCPIAVNAQTREARQIFLDNPSYTYRHLLRNFTKREE